MGRRPSVQTFVISSAVPFVGNGSIRASKLVNMVLNVHRNQKAYYGRGEGGWGWGGMEVRGERDYIPIAILSLPE